MSEIKCLKDSETKKYIIPTDEWLKPLEPLITSISTKGKMMLAKMVSKEKVVVKLTQNTNLKRIKNISYLVRSLPNFPKTYCVFQCIEDETKFDTNYLDSLGFCKNNPTSTDPLITLEIMKLYKNKLSELKNSLDINQTKPILKQLIFSLINAFQKTGFIHGDLHIDNILLDKKKETVKLGPYNISEFNYYINSNIECIIMDFDKSITYNIMYMDQPSFLRENTLIFSVKKVIQMIGSTLLIKTNKYDIDQINQTFDRSIKKIYFDIIAHGTSILGSFYSESRSYSEFISESVTDTMHLINIFWKELYDEYLFREITIEAYK